MKINLGRRYRFDLSALWTERKRYPRRDSEALIWHRYLGYGFYRMDPIRQGFWRDKHGELVVGFIPSESNFHYAHFWRGTLKMFRSACDYPEPPLQPIPFMDGIKQLLEDQRVYRMGDSMLEDLQREADK